MTCSCPKCNATVAFDETTVSNSGISHSCPECKARFWIQNESFARRALSKEGRIYCASCGNGLNHMVVCPFCGVRFPDYFLVQTSKPSSRKVNKPGISLSFSLQKKERVVPQFAATKPKASPKRLATVIGVVVVAAAIAGAGGLYYYKKKAENLYSRNFVLAVYLMKTGTDIGLKQSLAASAEWKAKLDVGQSYTLRPTADYETQSNKIKTEVDGIMGRFSKPPKKYAGVNEKLMKLNSVYVKTRVLPITPVNSQPAFSESIVKTQGEYNAAVNDLKGAITGELAEAVTKGKQKYKGLSDF